MTMSKGFSLTEWLMTCRSFFGQESQAGDFDLGLKSILAADSDLV